jgi:hypothetical protein
MVEIEVVPAQRRVRFFLLQSRVAKRVIAAESSTETNQTEKCETEK